MANYDIHANLKSIGANKRYFFVRQLDCNVRRKVDGVFEVYGTGGRTANDYFLYLTDLLGDHYAANMPTDFDVPAGDYIIPIFEKKGANPADSDGPPDAGGLMRWDGTQERTEAEIVMYDDTHTQPVAGIPPAAPSLATILNYLYRLIRNKKVTNKTAPSKLKVYKDNGVDVLMEASIDDNNELFTKDTFGAP